MRLAHITMDWFLRNLSNRAPDISFPGFIVLAALVGVFLVAGIILLVVSSKKRKSLPFFARGFLRLGGWLIAAAFYLGIWTFIAYERVQLFGSLYALLLGFLTGLVWLGFVIRYFVRTAPRLREDHSRQMELKKYLP